MPLTTHFVYFAVDLARGSTLHPSNPASEGLPAAMGWTVLAGVLFWADLRGAGRAYRPLALLVVVLALVTSVVWEPFAIASRDRAADPLTNGAFLTGLGVVALLMGVAVAYRRRAGAVGKDGAGSATAAAESSAESAHTADSLEPKEARQVRKTNQLRRFEL